MSILQTIKADQLAARKARDKFRALILTTLYGEAATVGLNDGKRESTDEETLAVVAKFLKNLNEVIDDHADGDDRVVQLHAEAEIYEHYLPDQLNDSELRNIITQMVTAHEGANMGFIMSELKAHHGGEYDGKTASKIASTVLAEMKHDS